MAVMRIGSGSVPFRPVPEQIFPQPPPASFRTDKMKAFPPANAIEAGMKLEVMRPLVPQGAWLFALLLGTIAGSEAYGAQLPHGFVETELAQGITGATAMDFASDGRLFICEQTGALRIYKNGT